MKVSISGAGMIRDNIVSCIPEELSEMFDQEQTTICSNIQSQKSVLLIGTLLGGFLAVAGFIVILMGVIRALIRNTADQTNLRIQ